LQQGEDELTFEDKLELELESLQSAGEIHFGPATSVTVVMLPVARFCHMVSDSKVSNRDRVNNAPVPLS